jgi:hypothetical protein
MVDGEPFGRNGQKVAIKIGFLSYLGLSELILLRQGNLRNVFKRSNVLRLNPLELLCKKESSPGSIGEAP